MEILAFLGDFMPGSSSFLIGSCFETPVFFSLAFAIVVFLSYDLSGLKKSSFG